MTQPEPQSPNAIRELQRAHELLDSAVASLESQREILRMRGMNLPPMVLTTLSAIKNDVRKLENTLVEEQTELGQLRALADMSARITTSLDVDTVIEETMDIVIALTRAERGYLILVDEISNELDFRISRDDTLSQMQRGGGQPQVSRTILNEVLSTREPMLADNAFKDERLQGNVSIANFALRSVLCVPLMYRDTIIGVVYVDNRLQTGIFTEREKNLLTAFANTAAVAIANARFYAEIQQLLEETARVKELMDNVFSSIGSGVIATNASDIITTFNRAAEQILESPSDDTVGKMLAVVLPKISADLTEYLSAIREKNDAQVIDTELTTQDKGRIAINLKMTPLKDTQDNSVQGVAIVLDDVTEQVARDNQLRIMKTYLPPEMVDNIHTIVNLDLGGERRDVTCLFVEVRPLYTLRDVRPKELMEILNTFLSVATECIHRTQGVIDKYMGQEVMAMWNTQLNPTKNHAEKAIACALLMRERFVELYGQLGIDPAEPHFYRTGIHSGVATLGNVGSLNRRDFTAIGDTINLSKRLEENATRGQIIVSQDTIEQLQSMHENPIETLQFVELEPIQVKGRQQLTRIYEVIRNS